VTSGSYGSCCKDCFKTEATSHRTYSNCFNSCATSSSKARHKTQRLREVSNAASRVSYVATQRHAARRRFGTGIIGVTTYTWAGNSASGNAYRVRPVWEMKLHFGPS
jgi:hypothetical protein